MAQADHGSDKYMINKERDLLFKVMKGDLPMPKVKEKINWIIVASGE